VKLTIEIRPKAEGDLGGEWLVSVADADKETTSTEPDVTYAIEWLEGAIGLALERAYPGVDEEYR
jgi:hypothetical protein